LREREIPMKRNQRSGKEGFVFLAALALLVILGGVAVGLFTLSMSNRDLAHQQVLKTKAQLAAQAAADTAIARALAEPEAKKIEGEIKPMERLGEKQSASYEVKRAKASRFGDVLKSLPPEKEILWVKANGSCSKGNFSRAVADIEAIVVPGLKRNRVLVWAVK